MFLCHFVYAFYLMESWNPRGFGVCLSTEYHNLWATQLAIVKDALKHGGFSLARFV